MFKKIINLSIINSISSGLNFLSTILTVKIFGLDIFGEFAVFNSFAGILMLFFIALPPNYSIFKLQDDSDYIRYMFANFYVTAGLLAFLIIGLSCILYNKEVNYFLLYIYVVLLAGLNFFDIFFQAFNKLSLYFIGLLVLSILKIIILIIFLNIKIIKSLDNLILINLIPLSMLLLFFIIFYIRQFKLIKFISIKEYFIYIANNFHLLKTYYINTILKRLKDNFLLLSISFLVSSSIIGVLALILKVGTTILGQIRIIEAFLMNRKNLFNISKVPFLYFIFMQFLFIIVGVIYLKINTGQYYLLNIILYSFIVYPYTNMILIRNKLLANYNNYVLNNSYILYILCLGLMLYIGYIINLLSLLYIICIIVIVEFIMYFYIKVQGERIEN